MKDSKVEIDENEIYRYVEVAVHLPVESQEQIVSMVILHFDIPDVEAKRIVGASLNMLRKNAEYLLRLIDKLSEGR